MKYRHSFHAGNFADLHKHVTLMALLKALQRKEKGFAYLETHAGRGAYDLSHPTAEACAGSVRFTGAEYRSDELRQFATLIANFRAARNHQHAYPGSPLVAAATLRPQDRARLAEIVPAEARLLERELAYSPGMRVERGDGFQRLRAWLPPTQRRGLIFIDPPYEESGDFAAVTAAIADGLRRFPTGVFVAWYPIKEEIAARAWHSAFARAVDAATLTAELWLFPRDSRIALNGSGLMIVNPPFQLEERLRLWLPELQARLDVGRTGGTSITKLTAGA